MASERAVREAGETVEAFRRRVLTGQHLAGAGGMVVLREHNRTLVSSTQEIKHGHPQDKT